MKGLVLTSLVQVNITGVCGNSICESGEMADPDDPIGSPGTCPSDCASSESRDTRRSEPPTLACPVSPRNSLECGGHGQCNPASGACWCDDGFAGESCSDCAGGYQEHNGTCVLSDLLDAATLPMADILDAPDGQKDNWNLVIFIAAAAGACLIVAAAVVGLLLWRRARHLHSQAANQRARAAAAAAQQQQQQGPKEAQHMQQDAGSDPSSSGTDASSPPRWTSDSIKAHSIVCDESVAVSLADEDELQGSFRSQVESGRESEQARPPPPQQPVTYPLDISDRLG